MSPDNHLFCELFVLRLTLAVKFVQRSLEMFRKFQEYIQVYSSQDGPTLKGAFVQPNPRSFRQYSLSMVDKLAVLDSIPKMIILSIKIDRWMN